MKNLLFISGLYIIISAISFSANAQNHRHSAASDKGIQANKSPRFIEGIEIKGGNISYSGQAVNTKAGVAPVNSTENSSIEKSIPIQFKYSQLLNREVESVNNIPLFRFIEEWWDTPYRYGGHTKKGIDCSSFTGFLLGSVYSVRLPRTARQQYDACIKIPKDEMTEGDIVFFNTRGGVSHVGVYLGEGYFVHASTSNGVTINNLDEEYYSTRFLGAGRMNNPASTELAKTIFL
jgi:lipoprotein Spr